MGALLLDISILISLGFALTTMLFFSALVSSLPDFEPLGYYILTDVLCQILNSVSLGSILGVGSRLFRYLVGILIWWYIEFWLVSSLSTKKIELLN